MIRYNTSSDRLCKIIRNWCKENNYYFSLEPSDGEKDTDVYPFRILAPSYMEDDLLKEIRLRTQ